MGMIRHHAIIVTDTSPRISEAHALTSRFPLAATPLGPEQVNGYRTFTVQPDGSKEFWPASDASDRARDLVTALLDAAGVRWVEVEFDYEGGRVTRSDADEPSLARPRKRAGESLAAFVDRLLEQ